MQGHYQCHRYISDILYIYATSSTCSWTTNSQFVIAFGTVCTHLVRTMKPLRAIAFQNKEWQVICGPCVCMQRMLSCTHTTLSWQRRTNDLCQFAVHIFLQYPILRNSLFCKITMNTVIYNTRYWTLYRHNLPFRMSGTCTCVFHRILPSSSRINISIVSSYVHVCMYALLLFSNALVWHGPGTRSG